MGSCPHLESWCPLLEILNSPLDIHFHVLQHCRFLFILFLVSVFITNKTNIYIDIRQSLFVYIFVVCYSMQQWIYHIIPVHLLWASASSSMYNTATVWNCSVETVSLYCYSTILLQFRIIMYKQYYYITTVWNHKVATVSLYCYRKKL